MEMNENEASKEQVRRTIGGIPAAVASKSQQTPFRKEDI